MEKEQAPKQISMEDRIRRKYHEIVHPASSASEDAFRDIVQSLPPGDVRKAMQDMIPQFRDLLKPQDRSLVIGSLMQKTMAPVVLGIFGGVGGAAVGAGVGLLAPPTLPVAPIVGAVAGGLSGIGMGLSIPTESQTERMRIQVEAARQKMTLQTTAGQSAAGMFDSDRIDQITKAIIWGGGALGGGAPVLREAST